MAFWNKHKEEEDTAFIDSMRRYEEYKLKAAAARADMERKKREQEEYYKMCPPMYVSPPTYSPHDAKFCGVTYEAVFAMKGLFTELGLEPTADSVEVLREFIKEAKV